MTKSATIALLYAVFAVISTATNIASQEVVRLALGGDVLYVPLAFGTGVGLVTKYLLDKKWIFQYKTENAAHDAKTFTLYTSMGVITTVIFWGMELGFNAVFGTPTMRYVGGVIGLSIGYFVKYRLDKRFVFC